MIHEPGCSRPKLRRDRITPGFVRLKCPECGRVENVTEASPFAQDNSKAPATGYRCRVHHDQAVTWRGTGCTLCTRKPKARKAIQPRDDYEMETFR